MLIEFTVGNFRSFKNKVTFSLVANSDDWLDDDNVAVLGDVGPRLLKVAAIYGPNAGGKTNLLRAMIQFRELVLKSSKESQVGDGLDVTPFKLSSQTEKDATFFEATFLHHGKRFRYGFEATSQEFTAEWLFTQEHSIRETRLFTREGAVIDVRPPFKEGRGLEERTRPNALFLSVVAQFNGKIAGEVLSWMEQFRAINGIIDAGYINYTTELLSDAEYGKAVVELVRKADLGIKDVVRQDIDKDHFSDHLPKQFPQAVRDLLLQGASKMAIIKSLHDKLDENNKPTEVVEFDFGEAESAGTRQFFGYAGPFLNTIREGSILIVDELDARLHPLLTQQLIALFNSSANRKNAQLIFAAHDQGLLDQRKMRRDQIWFVEKNIQSSSDLFNLSELSGVRKDANFEKEYLLGIFGGVPHLGDFQKVLDDAE